MILTDDEMRQVRQCIEAQAGLDEELAQRCNDLLRIGKYDEAVRSAFVLVEERLRAALKIEGGTGMYLIDQAFAKDSPLARRLGYNDTERQGLHDLFAGAFRLFRNPTAHTMVGIEATDGKAITALVNLMLRMLKRTPIDLPENLENGLTEIEQTFGPGATARLRAFLSRCVVQAGLKADRSAERAIPFKRHALVKYGHWDTYKPHPIAVFYLHPHGNESALSFSRWYYGMVAGFDMDGLFQDLAALGFRPRGKGGDPAIEFRTRNDQGFFDELYALIAQTVDQLEEGLHQEE